MEQLAGHMALAVADLLLWQHAPVTVRVLTRVNCPFLNIPNSTTLINYALYISKTVCVHLKFLYRIMCSLSIQCVSHSNVFNTQQKVTYCLRQIIVLNNGAEMVDPPFKLIKVALGVHHALNLQVGKEIVAGGDGGLYPPKPPLGENASLLTATSRLQVTGSQCRGPRLYAME